MTFLTDISWNRESTPCEDMLAWASMAVPAWSMIWLLVKFTISAGHVDIPDGRFRGGRVLDLRLEVGIGEVEGVHLRTDITQYRAKVGESTVSVSSH